MADTKISAASDPGPLVATDRVPLARSGSSAAYAATMAEVRAFAANFGATSAVRSLANATASAAIAVQKCLAAADPTSSGSWVAAGTLTFAAGGHAATLATAGGTALTVAAGDMLRLVAPASADATLAGVFVTLAGDRT
jgi:hypothetical protein